RQPARPELLVPGIAHPVLDRLRHVLEQVADIMQERGHDEVIGRALDAGEVCRLQAVLGHRDALAEVGRGAEATVERAYLLRHAHGPTSLSCRRSRAVALKTLS